MLCSGGWCTKRCDRKKDWCWGIRWILLLSPSCFLYFVQVNKQLVKLRTRTEMEKKSKRQEYFAAGNRDSNINQMHKGQVQGPNGGASKTCRPESCLCCLCLCLCLCCRWFEV